MLRFHVLLCALACLALAGCGITIDWDGPAVAGSGISTTESRSLPAFDRIDLSGEYDVVVEVGRPRSLTITGDDNLLSLVQTEVRGGTLHIDKKQDYRTHREIRIEISVERLEGFHSGGSSEVVVRNIRSSSFDVGVSGSSELTADGDFGDLRASISGSGEIRMEGTADEIDASVSGSGELDLLDVAARTAHIGVSGSGGATLNVSERLEANVSGSGDVRYAGRPSVRGDVSGSGRVEPL
jgi:hypothetical protein